MNPLVFLLVRRIVNGIRRSFKTPVRAFMTILVVMYLSFSVLSMFAATSRPHAKQTIVSLDPNIPLALLTLVHLALCLYVIPPPKYMITVFSEVDVANIYPTPLRRWRVFRFFLFMRGYLGILFLATVGAAYGFWFLRAAIPGIFPPIEETIQVVEMVFYAMLVPIALAGLLFWRMVFDIYREYDLLPKRVFRSVVSLVFLTVTVFVVYHILQATSAGFHPMIGLSASMDAFPLSFLLAPFRFLAAFLLGRADPLSLSFWLSLGFWLGAAVSGYRSLQAQDHLLYDYAGRIAEFRAQLVENFRNPAKLLKERARNGDQSLELPWLLQKMRPHRASAIFWRDMIIAWRSFGSSVKGLHHILLFVVIAGWFVLQWFHVPIMLKGVWTAAGLSMFLSAVPLAMVSVLSFAEILRRTEVQKPLPISARDTVTMHILQWTVFVSAVSVLPFLTAAVLFAHFWYIFVFILIIGWSFTHTIVSGYFWVTLYNPDQLDPIQRMYAALFGLAVSVAASLPALLAIIVGTLIRMPLAAILILVLVLNLATASTLHYLSSRKYANFLFTE